MDVPENFHTRRLHLRRPEAEDAAALFAAYTQDPEVVRFLVWAPHSTVEDTRAFLVECRESWRRRTEYTWVIVENSHPIGMISARRNGYHVELGYVLAKRHWGHGFMPEAARCIMDWWLAQPGIRHALAYCDAENTASARVLEKIGMQREALIPRHAIHPNISPEPRDCYRYSKARTGDT
jgi:RimJ/RimL family protein N-acetyltransferase